MSIREVPPPVPRGMSRMMPCPVCGPHEQHILPCDRRGCVCRDVPIPGLPAAD